MLEAVVELLRLPSQGLIRRRGGRNRGPRAVNSQLLHLIAHASSQESGNLQVNNPDAPEPQAAEADELTRQVKRATGLLKSGYASRAASALYQTGVADMSNQSNMEQLKALHPRGPSLLPPLPEGAPTIIVAPDEDFCKLIRSLSNGASPGPSGWTGEMLAALTEDEDCVKGIAALTSDIRNGNLDKSFKDYLLGACLVGVPKPNQKIRPIAVGEVFLKLALTHSLGPHSDTIARILQPIQFGVCVKGGVEISAHLLQSLLKDTITKRAGVCCDFRNAFNERNRAQILSCLFNESSLTELWRTAHWCYADSSPLWVKGANGDIIAKLESSNGVRQGDPLGSLLFALSMKHLYSGAMSAANSDLVTAVAVLDDITFVGEPSQTIYPVRRSSRNSLNLRALLCNYQRDN
jgi:hypothetical protein